jgi:hypothetical protein
MKLTIIKDDGAVYKDGKDYLNLNLNSIPSDVHALQWNNDKGHIEFVDNVKPNEFIVELPSWANDALVVWQVAYDAEQIEIAKAIAEKEEIARLRAELAQQQSQQA